MWVLLLIEVSPSFDNTHRSIYKWSRVLLEAFEEGFWNFNLHERTMAMPQYVFLYVISWSRNQNHVLGSSFLAFG